MTTKPVANLSIPQARRIALGAQGFNDPRPKGKVDVRHLRRVMGRLKLIQLDSVPVVIRTQYLPSYSRLGPYRADLFDDIAYARGEWFETWAHEASVVPVATEPLLRWRKERAERGETWKGLYRLAQNKPEYIAAVLAEVTERGPIAAGELADPRRRKGEWWDSRSEGSHALDWLFRIGVLGIQRTGNFAKKFDLAERLLPEEIRHIPTPSVEDAHRALLLQAAEAHGVGTAADLADYFRLKMPDVRPRLKELVENGDLLEVAVKGWDKPAYLHPEAARPRRINARCLLSPFDPVVWHRDRAVRLFDFEYKIEIYTPAAERRWGYYVLPFLLGDRLVGRVDLKTDRKAGRLRILGAYAEEGVDLDEVGTALGEELTQLAELCGVTDLEHGERGNLLPFVPS